MHKVSHKYYRTTTITMALDCIGRTYPSHIMYMYIHMFIYNHYGFYNFLLLYLFQSEPETVRVSPKKRIESYLASAGLVLGSAAASNTDPESANDHISIWTTRISSKYHLRHSRAFKSISQQKYRRIPTRQDPKVSPKILTHKIF